MALNNVLSDIISIAKESAPLLGSLLGSPLVGVGLSLLASVFGGDPKSPQEILSKIQIDPDKDVKLKQLELDHQDLFRKLQSTDYQTQVDDVKSAREREEKVLQLTGKFDWVQHVLAIIVVVGFFLVIAMVFITSLDKSDHDVLYMLVGVLGTTFGNIYSFYFGSSLTGNINR